MSRARAGTFEAYAEAHPTKKHGPKAWITLIPECEKVKELYLAGHEVTRIHGWLMAPKEENGCGYAPESMSLPGLRRWLRENARVDV